MFELILTLATLLTGLIWLGWALHARYAGGAAEEGDDGRRLPFLVDQSRAFFPVLLIVLVLRTFVAEPFRIPSASMMPTLLEGDFILVNKFTYGLRLPVLRTEILDLGEPRRGDVVVFRFPPDESMDYIKRVVGLPGDRIQYRDKQLYINGEPVPMHYLGEYQGKGAPGARLLEERLGEVTHEMLHIPWRPGNDYPDRIGAAVVVPPGHYFVMGDNRDNSNDSRVWGFVPRENLVGRAFFIWLSWDMFDAPPAWDRMGETIR